MTTALQVARHLVQIACADEDPLTHLRLQKLLYYVQGWSLAIRNRPMFADRIEAWVHGPVVPAVWQKFTKHGRQVILPDQERAAVGLTPGEQDFVARVWDAYKDFSAFRLRAMTHNEPPWKKARRGLPSDHYSGEEITQQFLREYFSSLN